MKKEHTVSRTYFYRVYTRGGRYYVDLFKRDYPIHSYATLEGVKEALYYAGLIDSKKDEI